MNKRERRQAKKQARELAKKMSAAATPEDVAAIERASADATDDRRSFNTLEEANNELHETARIINMNERKKAKAKAEAKTAKAAAGGKKERKTGLPTLPALPKVRGARKPKPEVDCQCGCGGKTKSKFMPGHDSYLRGLVMRVERKIMTLDDIEKKVGKGQRAAVERELAKIKKEARAAKKEAGSGKAVSPKIGKASDEELAGSDVGRAVGNAE